MANIIQKTNKQTNINDDNLINLGPDAIGARGGIQLLNSERRGSTGSLGLERNPFKTSGLRRSPPTNASQTVVRVDLEAEDESETNVLAVGGTKGQGGSDLPAGTSQHVPPERTGMLVETSDQEALLRRCKNIIDKMKKATQRQKNISNDVKEGLVDLEDAFDAIAYLVRLQKKQEAHLPNGSKSQEAPDTPTAAGTKKRPATSPADQKALQEKKIRDETQTPGGAGKALPENPRPRRERRQSILATKAAESKESETSNRNDYREVTKKRQKARKKFRPEALLIRPAQGQTYAEVLRQIRSGTRPDDSEAEVSAIRQTRAGDVLLELGPRTTNKEGFCEALRNVLGEKGKIKHLGSKVEVEICDLDGCTDAAEVEAAIKRDLPDVGDLNITVLPRVREQKMAIIGMKVKAASKLLNQGKIKIGWLYCRVRKRAVAERCYKCFDYGHIARACTGADRSKFCYKCFGAGHKARVCPAQEHCVLCAEKGMEQAQLTHFPGTGKCQVYRQALQAARKRL